MGLQGNLTAGEIVEQLAYAAQFSGIRNIVFMGMGEPLNNYNAVTVRFMQTAAVVPALVAYARALRAPLAAGKTRLPSRCVECRWREAVPGLCA
jgi:hypothetical protein